MSTGKKNIYIIIFLKTSALIVANILNKQSYLISVNVKQMLFIFSSGILLINSKEM